MVTKSLCASHQCTVIFLSSRKCSHFLGKKPTARKLKARTYFSARTGCIPKVKPFCRQGRPARTGPRRGYSTQLQQQLGVATNLRRRSTGTILLPNGWLLADGSCLVTAACDVTKYVQMRYRCWTCWCCPTPGLPLNSKYGLVRQQLQQKLVKSFFFFFF